MDRIITPPVIAYQMSSGEYKSSVMTLKITYGSVVHILCIDRQIVGHGEYDADKKCPKDTVHVRCPAK